MSDYDPDKNLTEPETNIAAAIIGGVVFLAAMAFIIAVVATITVTPAA